MSEADDTKSVNSDVIRSPVRFKSPTKATARESVVKSNTKDLILKLFGDVGDLKESYSSAVESRILLHGRMYVTNKFMCFYSSLFGLEKKIRIPLIHISEIRKVTTALVIPNAIAVVTPRKEYIFRSFWDRNEAYDLLDELIKLNRKGIVDVKHSLTDDVIKGPSSAPIPSNKTHTKENVAHLEIDHDDGEEHGEEDLGIDDPEEMLQREVRSAACKRKVTTFCVDMKLDVFIKMFIANGADASWAVYHKNHGDEDVVDEDWHKTSTKFGDSKVIHFNKIVNLPGLRATRGKKVQRFKRFGDAGLILCSSTLLEDVPCADCFSVDDLCAVIVKPDGKLEIELSFEVKFIKSTMLKYMIESNTNTEMKKWLEKFAANMAAKASGVSNIVKGEVSLSEDATTKQPTPTEPAPTVEPVIINKTSDNTMMTILILQLILILLLVVAVFMLNSTVNSLQAEVKLITHSIVEGRHRGMPK